MLAAQYLGPNRIEPKEIPIPSLNDCEALVHVEACGFCGSDLNIVAGTHPRAKAPLTLGHELAGTIVELRGAAPGLEVGDRVTTYPLLPCGCCHACTHGNPHVCRQLRLFGFDVNGGMAEFATFPVSSLVRLPPGMSPQCGALIEPLAVAVHGVFRASVNDIRLAVVLGTGPIGLLTALVARANGVPTVVTSDVLTTRRALAESLGFESVSSREELHELVMKLSDQNGADVLFECAGHASSALEMTALVRSRGAIVNLGVFKEPVKVDMQAVNFKEIEIFGSRVYSRKDFDTAVQLALTLPLDKIVTKSFSIRDVATAFEQLRSGSACKIVVVP